MANQPKGHLREGQPGIGALIFDRCCCAPTEIIILAATVKTKTRTGRKWDRTSASGAGLGAAGATEAVFSVFSIESGWIPASIGSEPVDPKFRIRINPTLRRSRSRTVLSNSFGFGGNNVSILFGAP